MAWKTRAVGRAREPGQCSESSSGARRPTRTSGRSPSRRPRLLAGAPAARCRFRLAAPGGRDGRLRRLRLGLGASRSSGSGLAGARRRSSPPRGLRRFLPPREPRRVFFFAGAAPFVSAPFVGRRRLRPARRPPPRPSGRPSSSAGTWIRTERAPAGRLAAGRVAAGAGSASGSPSVSTAGSASCGSPSPAVAGLRRFLPPREPRRVFFFAGAVPSARGALVRRLVRRDRLGLGGERLVRNELGAVELGGSGSLVDRLVRRLRVVGLDGRRLAVGGLARRRLAGRLLGLGLGGQRLRRPSCPPCGRASRRRCRRARARSAPSPSCRRARPPRRRRRRSRRPCRRRRCRRGGRPRRARPRPRRLPRPGLPARASSSLPSPRTTKWSRCMSALPSRKKRRFVIVSSSCSRPAPGPISTDAIGAASSTRYACEREPATSERSRRSTSIAADASE